MSFFFFNGNSFKFNFTKGKQMAQSCFLPASHAKYKCNSFSGKNILLWLYENIFVLSFGVFSFMEVGAKEIGRFPLLSRMRGKFGLILHSPAYSRLFGQIALLDCSFTWPQRKLTLGQQSVGTGARQRMGLEAKTAFAYPFISARPSRMKGLCSLLWKG